MIKYICSDIVLEVKNLANLKSAIKRVDTNNKKRALNQSCKADMRTNIKRVENLLEANDLENAKQAYNKTVQKIDKAIQKGAIHKNHGNREKSRLSKKVNELSAS